jgi:hypothetical protein
VGLAGFGLRAETLIQEDSLEREEVDFLITSFDHYVKKREAFATQEAVAQGREAFDPPTPRPGTDLDDLYGEDPVNRPSLPGSTPFDPGPGGSYGGGFGTGIGLNSRQGAAYLIAMESMYQTLNFYGVKHYLEKTPASVDFKIIESKSGYFTKLNRLDVAFGLREFARYLTAHLCNDPSIDNFYKALSQVPAEEIGLRFKYDMAWALMGNFLPRQPNSTYVIGTRWSALGKIINTSKTFGANTNEGKELQKWGGIISDIVGLLGSLNSLMCFVDIRPKPKEEIRKRIVLTKLLNMERDLNAHYGPLKQLIDDAKKLGAAEQLNYIRAEGF